MATLFVSLLVCAVACAPAPGAEVAELAVRVSGDSLHVSARVFGAKVPQDYLFALYSGADMLLAADVDAPNATVPLPANFPGGSYTALLLPHQVRCTRAAGVTVSISARGNGQAKPLGYGKFVDSVGVPHRWYINRSGTLIWDGKAYIPAGAMFLSRFLMSFTVGGVERNEEAFRDDIKRLTDLKAAGVTDIYLNPCCGWESKPAWVWNRFAQLCDEIGVRYGLQVTEELAPLRYIDTSQQHTVSVKPGELPSIDITNGLIRSIETSNKVFYAAFASGELAEWGRAELTATPTGVHAVARLRVVPAGETTVRFIPQFSYLGGARDYWTCIDASYKARLHRFFSALRPGPGFRCWIDPLDNEQSFQDPKQSFLPDSTGFRRMFAGYLKRKYTAPPDVARAWAIMGTAVSDYDELARLVPLGNSPDGKALHLLDPVSGRTYSADPARSAYMKNVMGFRDSSVASFNSQIANLIKSHHDAPVVLKHEGTEIYTNALSHGGFDGLGAEAYGSDNAHLRDCSRAVHRQSLRCGRTMWELTTETGLAGPYIGYPDPLRMLSDYASMLEEGGKGTYCFLDKDAYGNPNGDWYTFNLAEDPRQLHWLGAYALALKSAGALPAYTPESLGKRDFLRDVLGVEKMDLGYAFQGLRIGSMTYIWNLTDAPLSLTLETPSGSRSQPIPANAKQPIVAAGVTEISGVDEANMAAARREWAQGVAKLAEMGVAVDLEDETTDWRRVLEYAETCRRRAGDAFATWMPGVNVDGDLSEWAVVPPLFLKNKADVEDSRYQGARFHAGYDDGYLYVACAVQDSAIVNNSRLNKLWNGDAVEIFVDLQPDADPGAAAYNRDCFQFIFAPTSADGAPAMTVISPPLPPDSVPEHCLWAVKKSSDGWTAEAAISVSDLRDYHFRPGVPIGFNIQLDQSDGADRLQMLIWRSTLDVFSNRHAFGRLSFGGARQTVPPRTP